MTGLEGWRTPSSSTYVPELDGLRALAIALVVCVHLGLLAGGFVGVNVFFCLSGYLIGTLLLRERERTGTIALRSFYVRRLGRLYPALVAMVMIAVPIAFVTNEAGSAARMGVAAVLALTYLQNVVPSLTGVWLPLVNHTWTLSQEEQFYLVAPWAMRRLRPERYTRTAVVLLVFAGAIAAVRLALGPVLPQIYRYTYENPLLNLDGMLVGVALALLVAGRRVPRWLLAVGRRSAVAGGAIVVLVATALLTDLRDWRWGVGLTITVGVTVVLLVHVSTASSSVNNLLRLRPLRWLGERSYGLYLYHLPIFTLFGVSPTQPLIEQLFVAVAALSTSIAITWASARWLEAPIRDWVRNRFGSPSLGATAASPRTKSGPQEGQA